jgi:hypothetical protein
MAIYVYDKALDRMVDKDTGELMNPEPFDGPFPAPRVVKDIDPYISPATGEYVSGRRAKRDDLAKSGCIDAADLPGLGGKFKNARFAKKRGLEHLLTEEARDTQRDAQ